MKEYSLGLLSGFKTYLLIKPTAMTNKKFEMAEIKDAPICMMFAYKIVFESSLQAVWMSSSVYIYVKWTAQ